MISYDNNGNMVDHADKGLLQINYNHLNLPNYIQFNQYVIRNNPFFGGSETVFRNMNISYRADGVKLRKVHNYFTGRSQDDAKLTTDYLDGFHYTFFRGSSSTIITDGLQFVPTSEGYFDFPQNKYIYQYKDQVGNVRVAFLNDGDGNAAIDRITDFYPFGLDFGGESNINTSGSISPNYLYGFQEQERQQETGWDSFKWRNYDPSMGRFFNIDPLSEKYNTWTPYAFSGNRVIDARELEGLEPHTIHKTYKEAADNFGQQYNNLSIRMKGEIGTRMYKGQNSDGTYYSYTKPITAGYGSGSVNPNLAEELPDQTVQVGFGHTHGEETYQVDLGNGQFSVGQNRPSNYGTEMGDIAESVKASKKNPHFEGDFVVTAGGYLFIYGPGTKNGTNDSKMTPDSTNLPRDPNSKTNSKNNNTNKITPEVLPTGLEEDNF